MFSSSQACAALLPCSPPGLPTASLAIFACACQPHVTFL